MAAVIEVVLPDAINTADPAYFFYSQVLNKTLHPDVQKLLNMSNAEFACRYCQRHADVDEANLLKIMNTKAEFYRWGGADLMRARDVQGKEKMVIIEMNSCPSGNKSVPYVNWGFEGFKRVMANAFVPLLEKAQVEGGGLAVFYDVQKQRKESLAYATMLAHLTGEKVYLADVGYTQDLPHFLNWTAEGVCMLKASAIITTTTTTTKDGGENGYHNNSSTTNGNAKEVKNGNPHADEWIPMRAIFRYVTRQPWVKLPLLTRTLVLNPVVACLAGGRNKLMAAKAYNMFNKSHGREADGMRIHIPLTIADVVKADIPEHAKRMNYQLVVKVPYSNCGVGVYTITSQRELDEFMASGHVYDKFVIQGLISHCDWPIGDAQQQLHHVGCRPNDDPHNLYVNDLRFMICSGPQGWLPCAMYSRRSAVPLSSECTYPSWDMLGTNLSQGADGTSGTDTSRLLLLDDDTFPQLNLSFDDLVESYVQTVLAATAVEQLCQRLMPHGVQAGVFDLELFKQLDQDNALLKEIARGCKKISRLHPELHWAVEEPAAPPAAKKEGVADNGCCGNAVVPKTA